MDYELQEMIDKKNSFLKKIEEKRRIMELISNPNVKQLEKPFEKMRKQEAAKKIQVNLSFKIYF